MNKEKLMELSDTLRGIAEGTHVASFEQWHEDGWINCKLKYRHEPQPPPPDPYAALKEAHAAGKTIQNASFDRSGWFDTPHPRWTAPVDMYRIKPEPRKVPLGPDDVMPGCAIRHINMHLPERSVASVDANCVAASNAHATPSAYDFNHLKKYFQINRSIPLTGKWDKDAWEPCYKLIEE